MCWFSQIDDGKLITERLQKVVDEKAKGIPVNLNEIKRECELTGVSADKLRTCSDISMFAQCIFVKIRYIIAVHQINVLRLIKYNMNINGDFNANNAYANEGINPNTNADLNVDGNGNHHRRIKPENNIKAEDNNATTSDY